MSKPQYVVKPLYWLPEPNPDLIGAWEAEKLEMAINEASEPGLRLVNVIRVNDTRAIVVFEAVAQE